MPIGGFQRAAASVWRRAGVRVRGADWFAIAVEIAIVVLGILIAFQVDRWAERRSQAKAERSYLERVEAESRANAAELQRIIRGDNENSAQLLGIIRAVHNPDGAPRTFPPNYGCGMLHLPAARVQASYQELASPNLVGLGGDIELRMLTGDAIGARRFSERQLDYFRDAFQRFGQTLDPFTLWQVDPVSGEFSCTTRVEAIRRDPAARAALQRLYRDRQRFAQIREEELKSQRRLSARAYCLLDESCGS